MKTFAFYLENNAMKVKAGDKLQLTVTGKAPNLLMYGIKGEKNADLLTLCDDPNDQNYLAAEKMNVLPEDVTATVVAVESEFGLNTVVISIDELENI